MKLLNFNEDAYNSHVETIQKTQTLFEDASAQLKQLGLTVPPKSLMDGNIHGRAEKHYREKYESSSFYKEGISFEKYMDLKEVTLESLMEVEETIKNHLASVFKFYPDQHDFYSYYELRREPEINERAGKKVELPITKLFRWVNEKEIEVLLDKKYFELYSTSKEQLQKIKDIEEFISASKKMAVPYELVKRAVGIWAKRISYDLTSYSINYFEVLKSF